MQILEEYYIQILIIIIFLYLIKPYICKILSNNRSFEALAKYILLNIITMALLIVFISYLKRDVSLIIGMCIASIVLDLNKFIIKK